MHDTGSFFVPPPKCDIPLDILVPTHNKLELTIKCINAIYENTTAPFHLIVVDDSTDKITPIYFEELKSQKDNVIFIHSDEPYKEGNQILNVGFAHAKTDYVATVMNSIRVEPEWEIIALDFLKQNPDVGMLGLKCLFAPECLGVAGLIESAGITMLRYTPVDIGRDLPSHRMTAFYECPATQWAFAIIRKKAGMESMPEGIYNGFRGWDDIDNCFVMTKNGWKVMYCGYGVGYHKPRATRGKDSPETKEANKENARIFYKRWGYWEEFKKDYPTDAKLPNFIKQEERGKNNSKKKRQIKVAV